MDNDSTLIVQPTAVLADSTAMAVALGCVSKEKTRENLAGVFVHSVDQTLRIVATDGHRLFLNAREKLPDEEWPEWLPQGVILPAEGLKSRLSLIGDVAKVAYATDAPFVQLSDPAGSCQFRLQPVQASFATYQPILDRLTAFEAFKVEEMTSTAFNSKYFKAAGDVAKALGSEAIRIHAMPGDQSPTLITFPTSPGSMLVLMPMTDNTELSSAAIKVLAAPVQGTIAALRAHKTRWERKSGTSAALKVAEYEARIAQLMRGLDATPALPAPSSEAAPEQPEAEAEENLGTATTDGQIKLMRDRSKWTPAQRKVALTRFVADTNAVLNGHDGLTIGQLADGVPVDHWFERGFSPEEAAAEALDNWRRIGSVLPPDEVQPGEADKPIGLLQSPKRKAAAATAAAPTKRSKPVQRAGRLDFDEWLGAVDREIVSRVGLGHEDLVDCNYRDWFEDGLSPKSAAGRAIKNQLNS